jgi:ABC-2 type transport system permease protein
MNGFIGIIVLDLKRLWINRIRVVTSLAQPLLYLFVLGSGIGANSRIGSEEYQRYIFPGVLALSLLFTASSAAIAIVVDRQVGFLKAVLVAPISRTAIAFGKIATGAVQALLPGMILLLFAPLIGISFTLGALLQLLPAMLLSTLVFSALGVGFAARLSNITVFPVFSNMLLLPLFFLSGAIYSLDHAPEWLKMLARFDPVAYAVDLMRGSLSGRYVFPVPLSLAVLLGFLAVFAYAAIQVFDSGDNDN